MYDAKVPTQLKKTQQWFASIIGRPIDEDSKMDPISPSGELMELEAANYIVASHTLRPAQRIQIYNQQYWWRLLNILHDTFPTLIRLFGYYDFNKNIGIPYLVRYTPNHWSLVLLGNRMVQWLQEDYPIAHYHLKLEFSDLALLAQIDWAFNDSFIVKELPRLTQDHLADSENLTLLLQPHVALFQTEGDLFKFRNECLEHPPEYWLENLLPSIDRSRQYFFILFRNQNNDISWTEVLLEEYEILSALKSGKTINELCDWIEKQEHSLCEAATTHLQKWFEKWTALNWLSFQP